MRIGFIGAGKVGFTLGKWFSTEGIHVTGYYSRHIESAREAAEFTNTAVYESCEALADASDVIMITVPDGEITAVYKQLQKSKIEGKQICHCSGAMTADEAFTGRQALGVYGYSIHPLFPVSSKYESYKEIVDAFFCIEGDDRYLEDWKQLIEGMGAKAHIINPSVKVKYHAACSIASNLVCGLLAESIGLLTECGFDEQRALSALRPLVMNNIGHVMEDGPVKSLTGPLERGDVGTIEKHIRALDTDIEKLMYTSLSEILLKTAKVKNPDRDYKGIEETLSKGMNDIL